jgi:hypothetical protein
MRQFPSLDRTRITVVRAITTDAAVVILGRGVVSVSSSFGGSLQLLLLLSLAQGRLIRITF